MLASIRQWRPTDKLWQGNDAAKLWRLEQLCLNACIQQQGNALEHGIHEIHPLEDPFPITIPASQQTKVRVRASSTYSHDTCPAAKQGSQADWVPHTQLELCV